MVLLTVVRRYGVSTTLPVGWFGLQIRVRVVNDLPDHSTWIGLPSGPVPSCVIFTFANEFLKVAVANFVVPGVIFDFASFSFHVPICGSAAKHAAQPRKQMPELIRVFFYS